MQQSTVSLVQKVYFLSIRFRVGFEICLTVYKCTNSQALEYLKYMLLFQDTESEKKTRQDYDKIGLRTPPVENLKYNCRNYRYAAPVVWNRLPRSVRESVRIKKFKTWLRTFYFNKWLA